MIDDIAGIAVGAALDVAVHEGAKRSKAVRLVRICIGAILLGVVAGLVLITLKYS